MWDLVGEGVFLGEAAAVCASTGPYGGAMITCVVHYTINPAQIEAFERFARAWMRLVAKHGGVHHGYFLPAEGASDQAEALFSFESLAAYERYRARFGNDPEFVAADSIRDDSGCVVRYERTFMRPLLPTG
ncbi:NIPSNAP family protein [Micromonospora coerulea]|uniref:NIPSNAP family protein n=2 Tax=Micromonospora coerulea TaxID=47856 RepID=A0ABP8SS13_9ACTN